MTPWELAREQWERDCEATEGSFEGQLAWHFAKGFVISTPDLFALVMPEQDAWFVTMAAATKPGWVRKLMQFMDRKEFIKWRRNGERRVRTYRWEQLARR